MLVKLQTRGWKDGHLHFTRRPPIDLRPAGGGKIRRQKPFGILLFVFARGCKREKCLDVMFNATNATQSVILHTQGIFLDASTPVFKFLSSAEPESCFQDTADHVRASQFFWHRHDLRPSAKDPPADPWTRPRTQCEQAFSLRWPPLVRNSFPGVIRLVSA